MSTPLQEISWDDLKPADESAAQAAVAIAGNKLAAKRAAQQQLQQQASKQGFNIQMDWSQLTPEPTAAHEAIMRDGGVDLATADKMVKSGVANHVAHLPPAVPTAKAPIDRIAANYEIAKNANFISMTNVDYDILTAPLKAAGFEIGPDYIKPPGSEADWAARYPQWWAQIQKQQSKPAPTAPDTRAPITRAFARGGEMLAGTAKGMLEPAVESVVGTLKGDPFAQPKAAYKAFVKPQIDQLQQAYEGWKHDQQDPNLGPGMVSHETVGHFLAGITPFFGPVAAAGSEKVGKGVGKLTVGDARGWGDILDATPEIVMLAAPLAAKAFAAIDKGVPVEKAMSSAADQLRPLLEKRLKEQIPAGETVATGVTMGRAEPMIPPSEPTPITPATVINVRAPGSGRLRGQMGVVRIEPDGTATFERMIRAGTKGEPRPPADLRIPMDEFEGLFPDKPEGFAPGVLEANRQQFIKDAAPLIKRMQPKEVTNARQRPQVLSQAGPTGEAYRGVGNEAGSIAEAGQVNRLRDRQQAEGPQEQITQEVTNAQEPVSQVLRPEPAAGAEAPPQGEVAQAARPAEAGAETVQAKEPWQMTPVERLTDAAGNPKPLYHGTRGATGKPIKPGKGNTLHSQGIWLTEVPEKAQEYADLRPSNEGAPSVRQVTLDIKNPATLSMREAKYTTVEELKRQGYDSAYIADTGNYVAFDKGQISEGTAGRQGERSLPSTLKEAGLIQGTDLTYDIASNPATVAKAQENLATKGVAGAAEYVRSVESPTAEHTATGFAVIRALQDAGEYAKAADVASDLSAKLTANGQAVQAVKTIAQFAPERAVVTAQKVLDASGKGRKLSPVQAERITNAAKAIESGNGKVAAAEAKVDAVAAKLPAESPANWRAKLTAAEDAARSRLAERQAKMKAGELKEFGSGGLSTEELLDYATIGAAKLARKGIDFATWSKEMVGEFGDSIKPHLARIYRASFEQYSTAKRDAYQAMKERAVQKGLPPMTAEELATAVKQRDLAIKARTAATRQLAAEYEALQPGQRVKRELVSAMNAPRSIKASLDLSAPLRQGAVFVTEPKIAAQAFGKQISALREAGYEKAYRAIQRSPEFDNARSAGLEFTGSPLRGNDALSLREEAFMSRWAEKIPGVAASERAYVTYLDTLRINLFEKYAAEIRQAVKDPKAADAELRSVASFINKATGRGDLGKYGNAAAPILNSVFFAPRYAISRLQILNPVTYAKMTPVARSIALRKMFQFTGLVGTTLALAKASGLEVGTDVESPDFLKIKVGDTRFDLLAGEQQYMRAAARLAKGFYANATDAKLKDSEQPASVAGRFARSKLAPVPSLVADLATGKTFEGEPVVPKDVKGQPPLTTGQKVGAVAKREGGELFTPLFIKDAYDAWRTTTTGIPTKIAATAGGLLGVGVQTYPNKRAEPSEFKKLSMEDAAKAYSEARPEQRLQLRRELIKKRDAALQHAKTLADRRRIYDEYRQAVAAQ